MYKTINFIHVYNILYTEKLKGEQIGNTAMQHVVICKWQDVWILSVIIIIICLKPC